MPTKKDILQSISSSNKKTYSTAEVNYLITSVSSKENAVKYLKKGDVITYLVGTKVRPCVVAKLCDETCWVIPLSSTEDELNLYPSKSRFYGSGYFSRGIVSVRNSVARENFIGIYDNHKRLNKAIEVIKKELSVL